jgi:hypothetical protein
MNHDGMTSVGVMTPMMNAGVGLGVGVVVMTHRGGGF